MGNTTDNVNDNGVNNIVHRNMHFLVDKTFQPVCKRPCSLMSEFTGQCAWFVVVVNTQELVVIIIILFTPWIYLGPRKILSP